ncbi:MAG: SDR family oxidoreductase [Gemmatimonadetes bacterium]|nr:SDR family oxidoreductase [Gemmatimonadota bacterium]
MAAAAAAGAALGITTLAGGALLLYSGRGFLASAGFLVAAALAGLGAGVWAGTPADRRAPHRMAGRWMLAILALVVASFAATAWLRIPALQTAPLGAPLGMVLFLAEPAYAIGALLAGLQRRRPSRPDAPPRRAAGRLQEGGSVVVPALFGSAAGAVLAASWLIPALPPGPVFFGAALLLSAAGTAQLALAAGGTEESMDGTVAGSVVLITGVGKAGQVGYALAEAFRERGARLVLVGRSEEVEARAAELGGEAVAVRADLATEAGAAAAVDAARERWGRLDTVVNAVGGLRVLKSLGDTTPEEWSAEIERNAGTAFLVSRAALPLLRESRGSIVNFASPAGERAVAKLGAYSAAKAGVVALTRAMALEERAAGVRVNAVAPGVVDTAENRAAVEDAASAAFVSRGAIAEVVLFLAGARGVSGQVVHVTNADVRGAG